MFISVHCNFHIIHRHILLHLVDCIISSNSGIGCDVHSIFTLIYVLTYVFFPVQPEQWEVGDKDPDSIIQVLKVFQGLLKVFCTTHQKF